MSIHFDPYDLRGLPGRGIQRIRCLDLRQVAGPKTSLSSLLLALFRQPSLSILVEKGAKQDVCVLGVGGLGATTAAKEGWWVLDSALMRVGGCLALHYSSISTLQLPL